MSRGAFKTVQANEVCNQLCNQLCRPVAKPRKGCAHVQPPRNSAAHAQAREGKSSRENSHSLCLHTLHTCTRLVFISFHQFPQSHTPCTHHYLTAQALKIMRCVTKEGFCHA